MGKFRIARSSTFALYFKNTLQTIIMNKQTDQIIGAMFLALSVLFVVVALSNSVFFNWAFQRHHNQWSWYIRPIFLIPFCYFAYQKSFAGIFGSLFCLLTSMFWFPAPETVSDEVKAFLAFEQNYLQSDWTALKILFALLIPIALATLAISFWKRSLKMGLAVVVLMAVGKMLWSVQQAGEAGASILVPAVVGLLVCSILLYIGFQRLEKNRLP